MKIRRFIGNDFQATLALVKKELGPDAVILSAREVKQGFGLRRNRVEVTAALDFSQPAAPPKPGLPDNDDLPREPSAADAVSDRVSLRGSASVAPRTSRAAGRMFDSSLSDAWAEEADKKSIESVLEEVQSLRRELRPLISGFGQKELYPLVRTGMDDQLASHLLERAGNNPAALRQTVASDLKVGKPASDRRVYIFVGPTGVGKTTTLAKLAAHHVREGRKATITTFDRFRPGGEAPLRAYAEKMRLPFKTLSGVSEMFDLLNHTQDTIFVDTPGRSPGDRGFLDGLLSLQFTDMPMNTYLLLGANADPEVNLSVYKKYNGLKLDSLIFTKVDEGARFGSLYNVAMVSDLPVAYLTTGQQVPDDISAPTRQSLANLILGGDWS